MSAEAQNKLTSKVDYRTIAIDCVQHKADLKQQKPEQAQRAGQGKAGTVAWGEVSLRRVTDVPVSAATVIAGAPAIPFDFDLVLVGFHDCATFGRIFCDDTLSDL